MSINVDSLSHIVRIPIFYNWMSETLWLILILMFGLDLFGWTNTLENAHSREMSWFRNLARLKGVAYANSLDCVWSPTSCKSLSWDDNVKGLLSCLPALWNYVTQFMAIERTAFQTYTPAVALQTSWKPDLSSCPPSIPMGRKHFSI